MAWAWQVIHFHDADLPQSREIQLLCLLADTPPIYLCHRAATRCPRMIAA